MKKLFKYLIITGLNILFLALVIPANAQRGGGGGGGHSGGGGGGGGGHFSGGGGGFSGGSHSFSGASRGSFSSRSGVVQRSSGGTVRYSSNTRAGGVNGTRGYVRGTGAGVYGHGGGSGHYGWGRHGGYFYNGGFYGSLYYPWLGFNCWYLPYGYDMFYWNDYPYYFSDGYYYQYNNDEYTVVEPPIGALIKTLPSDAKSIVINGQQYYELNGVYYLPMQMDGGKIEYQVAGKDGELNTDVNGATSITPKVGDVVTKLPADCRKVKLNGGTFFVSEDGVYYQEIKDQNNNTVYKIVGLESDGQGN